jgi:hypothetical protein
MGVITVLVKGPDTTFLQFLMLFFACIGAEVWLNWTLPDLAATLDSLLATSSVTISSIATGAVGAVILLVITIPPVGLGEWPDVVPTHINDEYALVIVRGSYGEGHINARAQDSDGCEHTSHQAIVDDPYQIKDIIKKAQQVYSNESRTQFFYSFIDNTGKEWVAVTRIYTNISFPGLPLYELRSAYRVDCGPFRCVVDGEWNEFNRVYEKWNHCEKFILIFIR